MTLDAFATANAPAEGGETFQHQNRTLLAVDLDGSVTALAGSTVAYSGDVTVSGKASAEDGGTGFVVVQSFEER